MDKIMKMKRYKVMADYGKGQTVVYASNLAFKFEAQKVLRKIQEISDDFKIVEYDVDINTQLNSKFKISFGTISLGLV